MPSFARHFVSSDVMHVDGHLHKSFKLNGGCRATDKTKVAGLFMQHIISVVRIDTCVILWR